MIRDALTVGKVREEVQRLKDEIVLSLQGFESRVGTLPVSVEVRLISHTNMERAAKVDEVRLVGVYVKIPEL